MTLDDYKHDIAALLDEAALILSCEELEELIDYLHDEGLV